MKKEIKSNCFVSGHFTQVTVTESTTTSIFRSPLSTRKEIWLFLKLQFLTAQSKDLWTWNPFFFAGMVRTSLYLLLTVKSVEFHNVKIVLCWSLGQRLKNLGIMHTSDISSFANNFGKISCFLVVYKILSFFMQLNVSKDYKVFLMLWKFLYIIDSEILTWFVRNLNNKHKKRLKLLNYIT